LILQKVISTTALLGWVQILISDQSTGISLRCRPRRPNQTEL